MSVGADSADFAIVERLQAGDVVVTQDIGLASMVLGRDAAAIGVRGRVYDKATIDMQLFIRHEEKKVRRARRSHSRSGGIYQRRSGPALSATSPSCALTKVDFWDMSGNLLFALGGVSAQNPWLNKKRVSKCHASPHCAGAEHGYFETRFVRPT